MKISKSKYLLFTLLPLILVLGLILFFPNFSKGLWDVLDEKNIDIFSNKSLFGHINKEVLFVVGGVYSLILYFYWIFKNRIEFFNSTDKIQKITLFLLGISVTYWVYSRSAKYFILLFITILIINGLRCKNKYKVNISIFMFAFFCFFQFISLLWFTGEIGCYKAYLKDPFILLVVCISMIFVRFSNRDKDIFISVIFKFFLLFMIWHVITYLLKMSSLDISLLSCFKFDKSYIDNRYVLFQFTKYMHPSFISWLLLIIAGISYTIVKNKSVFISKIDLIVFWVLLLWFTFIFQGRVIQLGYFIVLGLILFLEIYPILSKKIITIVTGISLILFFGGVFCLFNYTVFFNDPSRIKIYASAFESIENNLYFGSGMFSEKVLLEQSNFKFDHYHNDFYQTLIRQGLFGLIYLILCLMFLLFNSLKNKNFSLFLFLVPMILIMFTDSPFVYFEIVSITAVFLFIFGENSLSIPILNNHEFLLTDEFYGKNEPKVTIFTPTYNRAYSLPRLYESLLNQVNEDFEWVIVDDGSLDKTTELVQNWIDDNKLKILYVKQENGGKHKAINRGVSKANGELFFIVDSDDFLTSNAVEFILNEYENIKNNPEFCGLSGLKIEPNGDKIGGECDFDVLECTSLDFRYKHKVQGDMAEVFKTNILKDFSFPEIQGEKFCQEALVFNRIAQHYKIRWVYEKIYVCEYLPDGLTYSFDKIQIKSPKLSKMYCQELAQYKIPESEKKKAIKQYYRFGFHDSIFALKFPFKGQGIIKNIGYLLSGFVKYLRDFKKL